MRITAIIFILLLNQITIAQQKKLLQGTWIKIGSTYENQLRYHFDGDNLFVSTSHSSFLGVNPDGVLVANKIKLPYYSLLIEQLDKENPHQQKIR